MTQIAHIATGDPDLTPEAPEVPKVPENAVAVYHSRQEGPLPRTLTTDFQRSGYRFRQIVRRGMLAIYEQTCGGNSPRYEVIRIRTARESTLPDGTVVPFREAYPSSEQWGLYGWTCFTLDEAQSKMQALLGEVAS